MRKRTVKQIKRYPHATNQMEKKIESGICTHLLEKLVWMIFSICSLLHDASNKEVALITQLLLLMISPPPLLHFHPTTVSEKSLKELRHSFRRW